MSVRKAKAILKKYGMDYEFSLRDSHAVYKYIEEHNDPLTFKEHIILFDSFWEIANNERSKRVKISNKLKLKLINHRSSSFYYYRNIASAGFKGIDLQGVVKSANLNIIEEAELWKLFQQFTNTAASRDSDEINQALGIYEIIRKKKKKVGKIKVLDVGCGKYGAGILSLLAKFPDKISGFGIDLNFEKGSSHVNLVKATAEKIPFANNSFDVIYSYMMIYHFSGKRLEKVFSEILRVLKTGGYLVIDFTSLDEFKNILLNLPFKVEVRRWKRGILIINTS